ncbi:NAD(P)-binding protein [Lojkania enalia]|uniref:NAD(P)-binding protein n=1 Tax=Lojkania enalia TaxID=147567 RepID=A0A9P4KCK3_9PLEO|nr:NAD(P)-binding protein [Didymosphaeria enalia]
MPSDAPVPKKILLFGATGTIGKYILKALIDDKTSFEKIGIFTSPGTSKDKADKMKYLKEKGVEVLVGDVNNEENVKAAYKDYDTVVSALGRNVILAQILLLSLARNSSTIRTFYPSEYGTDIEYAPSSAIEKPHQLKLRVRKHIRENITNLSITYLVTGPYSDLYISKMDTAPQVGSFDVQQRKAVLLGTGKEEVSFTTMTDVGRLLVAALKTPTIENPRTLKVNSFTATPSDILAEFENQMGKKWDVNYTSLGSLKGAEMKAWESNDPFATAYTLRRIWTEGGTLYEKRDNWKIGDPATETLEEQVRKAIEAQT